jgi:cytochrome c-type biogenesis protein CcmH
MTAFWTFAMGLIALALALVLPSLLRQSASPATAAGGARSANLRVLRDQLAQLDAELATGSTDSAQTALARAEIERRALEEESADLAASAPNQPVMTSTSKRTAGVVAIGIPLLALGLYGFLGNLPALQPPAEAGAGGDVTAAQIETMVTQMAQRLENQPPGKPADPEAWEMLARSYAAMQRFPEAAKAYARAVQLAPNNAQLLADNADVLAMLQGQSAAGEPTRLIERALKLEPNNLKALALAGSAAFERGDFAAATRYWTQARTLAPQGSDFANGLERSLQAARSGTVTEGATTGTQTGQPTPRTPQAASVGGINSISGVASLAPALQARIKPDDTVFIFARATDGPRMPLAIVRRKASELPITFTLDDSTAMSNELKLSKFSQVMVGARVSRSGNAMPQSGDLVGQTGPVTSGAGPLAITIENIQP